MSEKSLDQRMARIEKTLSEMLNWIRIANLPKLRDILYSELDTPEKKVIYEMTNGINTQLEISAKVDISRRTISSYWQKWQSVGILIPSKRFKSRLKRIVSLNDVGISVPTLKNSEKMDITFKPRDLKKILSNDRLFPSSIELFGFALDFMQNSLSMLSYGEREELTDNRNRQKLVSLISSKFRNLPKMKQHLFMQALERRAINRNNTEFQEYFEAWEKNIGR